MERDEKLDKGGKRKEGREEKGKIGKGKERHKGREKKERKGGMKKNTETRKNEMQEIEVEKDKKVTSVFKDKFQNITRKAKKGRKERRETTRKRDEINCSKMK